MKELDLTFSDFLQSFDLLGKSEWITVYSHNYTDEESVTFWTALLPKKAINKALTDPSWDLSIGDGSPGYSFTFRNGREIARYHRYFDGIEPLIYARSFNGMKEGYNELSEEFKLLFNLYEDKRGQKFIYIDDNGDDEEVSNNVTE